jgi:hypothetical protein
MLLLALGDPRTDSEQVDGRSVVLLVDASASMLARDEAGARRRIERARELAAETLGRLGPRDEVMLVRLGGRLEPLTPFTRDTGIVEELLRELDADASPVDLEEALRFSIDSLAGRPRGSVVLVSDGAFGEQERNELDIEVPPNVRIVHLPVGRLEGNAAITAFNVRRYPANRTNYEVYVRVESYFATPVTLDLSLWGEGAMVQSERIDLAPGTSALRIYPEVPAAGDQLEARLQIAAGDAVDVFPVDDTAYALMPPRETLRVLLVTDGNLYLEGPFLLNPSVETDSISPAAYAVDSSAEYDLTVFDGVAPPIADRGNYLYFAPSGPDSPWEVTTDVVDPIIHSSDNNHALLRFVSGLRDMNIARARNLRLTEDDHAVATAIGGSAMIVARETPGRRLAAVAFAPTWSDFPLRVAFPVFLLNAIDWFTGEDARLLQSFATGRTWFVPVADRSLESVSVTAPGGAQRNVPAWDGTAVMFGDQVGFWTVEAGDETLRVAGNLASAVESRIAPATDLALPGVVLATEIEDAGNQLAFDPWFLLVLAAFVLLALEWFTWQRRITV